VRPYPVDKINDYVWFIKSSGDEPQPVATRQPNGWDLYDMVGNVWEWINDWHSPDSYSSANRADPVGPAKGRLRVRRRGSYHCPLYQARPGFRQANKPDARFSVIGFRVVAEKR